MNGCSVTDGGKTSWADLVEDEEIEHPENFVHDSDWVQVSKKNKPSRKLRENQNIISVSRAYDLQSELNITRLADVLLSSDSKKIQMKGFHFEKVLTVQDSYKIDRKFRYYIVLNIPNKWKDQILYVKN